MLIWPKKVEHYKLKKIEKFLKTYMKIEKIIIKFGDIEIKKHITNIKDLFQEKIYIYLIKL